MKTKYEILEIKITNAEDVVTSSPEVETEIFPFAVPNDLRERYEGI